jgi:ATP-dependent Clp protease ATP-binding subunit ClpC
VKVEAPSVDEGDPDSEGPAAEVRSAPQGEADRRSARAGGEAFRALHHRPVPADKAIDVMDEAGARARINAMTRPPDVKEIEREIEEIRIEKEAAIKAQDFEKAASLRDKEKQTKDKLEGILAHWREEREEKEVLVTADDMMNIISKVTGVPLQKMEQKETEKLSRWKTS